MMGEKKRARDKGGIEWIRKGGRGRERMRRKRDRGGRWRERMGWERRVE